MTVSFRSHYPEWICNPVWQTSACNSVTSETFVLFNLNLKTWAWFSFEKVILQSFVNWALWLAIDIDSGSMPCLQTIASASCHSLLLEAAFVRKLHTVTCLMVCLCCRLAVGVLRFCGTFPSSAVVQLQSFVAVSCWVYFVYTLNQWKVNLMFWQFLLYCSYECYVCAQ